MTEPAAHPPATDEDRAVLQAILAHGPSMVVVIDGQYRIRSVNRIPAGLEQADVLGTSSLDYVQSEDRARVRQTFDEVLRSGQPSTYETQGRGPHDTPAWYLTHVLPLPPAAGTPRLLLLSEDVTARRHDDVEARHARHLLDSAVDAMPDFMCLIRSSNLRLQFVNRAYQALAPGKPMLGRTLNEIWPEAGRDFDALCRRVVETGEAHHSEDDVATISMEAGGTPATRSASWSMHRVRLPGTEGWGLVLVGSETTARREAEQRLQRSIHALRESEERLRLALEAADEGLWDWDLATDACYYSPGYYTMLGYPPDAMARHVHTAQELLHPDDVGVVLRGNDLLRDPGHFVLRFRMRGADGGYRWIESHGKTVQRDAAGRPLRAVGTHIDITERLRLEDEVQQGAALLHAIVDGTTDSVYVRDLQGRYVLANRTNAETVGRRVEDMIGRDDAAWFPAEVAQSIRDEDRQVIAAGEVVTRQRQIVLPDGRERTFLSTKGPLRDGGGRILGVFGIARDITEVLRQDAAQRRELADSRDLLEQVLASAELGTWDVDVTTGVARYDERYGAMLGLAAGELAPTMQAWLQRIHPDDLAAVREAMRAHDEGETRLYECEFRMRHRQGHWVWVLARGKVQRDADGRPQRSVGTHQDITDRRRISTEGTQLLRKIEALMAGLEPRGATPESAPGEPANALPKSPSLSPRHREVLGLLAAGLTAAEIAQHLGISRETANTHRRNLMRKLGLRNKAELIRFAVRHGIGERAGRPGAPDAGQ